MNTPGIRPGISDRIGKGLSSPGIPDLWNSARNIPLGYPGGGVIPKKHLGFSTPDRNKI